jgi:hypothetical protein
MTSKPPQSAMTTIDGDSVLAFVVRSAVLMRKGLSFTEQRQFITSDLYFLVHHYGAVRKEL